MKKDGKRYSRYQMRRAAGGYWLLDMEQDGYPYKQPMMLNEVGASIWCMIEAGKSCEQIVDDLSREYQMEQKMIEEDVAAFWDKLEKGGILDGKGKNL